MSLTLLEAAKAKLEGKRVEKRAHLQNWGEWNGESWAEHWEFRIAPKSKKRIYVRGYLTDFGTLIRVADHCQAVRAEWKRVPSEDKEIEVEE